MTTATLDLAPDTYDRLSEEAHRRGKPIEAVAEALLAERLAAPVSERERATEVLRAAGLLTEPGPEMKGRARPRDWMRCGPRWQKAPARHSVRS